MRKSNGNKTRARAKARPRPRRQPKAAPAPKRAKRTVRPKPATAATPRKASQLWDHFIDDDGDPEPPIVAIAQPTAVAAVPIPVRTAARLRTERELRTMPEPQWLIDGILQTNSFAVAWAPRESFKSFGAVSVAGSTVAGLPWFGAAVVQHGPVVYVPADDRPGFKARWFAWRTAAGIADDRELSMFTWTDELNLFTGRGFADFLADVSRVRPVLVVFDTWARLLAGGDENLQKDTGLAIERVDALRRQGAAVLAVHHSGVDGTRERGSSALGAAADTMLVFGRDGDNVEVSCGKQRNGPHFSPIRLHFDADAPALRLVSACELQPLPKSQSVVLSALRTLASSNGHGDGIEIKEWLRRSVDVEGVKRRMFFYAKKALIDGGQVRELDGAKFLPV